MPKPPKSLLPYTNAQWDWVADRYREGYRIKELAEFLGINRENVRKNLARLGVAPYAHDELDPLSSRKAEFNQLGD